jgi:hypothetical protein
MMMKSRRQRGSALILAVAVLALLAVMGTVYIVTSRTDRATSTAMSASLNLDLARDAVMNQVRTALFSASVDAHGEIGGLVATAARPSSRFYDYPEIGQTVGQTDANAQTPDEAWLVKGIYPASATDLSVLAAAGFDPQTNGADIPLTPWSGTTVIGDPAHGDADGYVYLLDFSGAGGVRYRYGVRVVDLCGMANLNSGGAFDANTAATLDPLGKYLSSYGLGAPSALSTARQGGATLPSTLGAWQAQLLSIERPVAAGVTFFDLSDELELRAFGSRGDGYACRPADVWPMLAAGQAARANYTTYSFTRDLRLRPDAALPAPSPPSTMPATQPASAPAAPSPPYTLTPADGNLFPANCAESVWPMKGVKVWANPRLDLSDVSHTLDSLFYHARAATNVATAMELAGYSTDESRAFAANYLSYRWNGMVKDAEVMGAPAGGAYYYPGGPSFVDHVGICVRVADAAGTISGRDFGSGSDLSSTLPRGVVAAEGSSGGGAIYLGYLPQPFVNEVAAQVQADAATGQIAVQDVAVELYNPYAVALSLRGFTLKAGGKVVALEGQCVPARGFLTVVQQAHGTLAGKATGAVFAAAGVGLDLSGGSVVLTRPYVPRGGVGDSAVTTDATVDAYPYDSVVKKVVMAPGTSAVRFVRRSNEVPAAGQGAWQSAVQGAGATTAYVDGVSGTLTLGALNPQDDSAAGAATPSLQLWDRFSGSFDAAAIPQQGEGFANFAEFNRVMRVGNQCADATVSGADSSADKPLSAQLGTIIGVDHPARPNTDETDFPVEAEVHFDFKATPWFFLNPSALPPAGSVVKAGDGRAVALFDYVAMVDRVYDTRFVIGDAAVDGDKLRLPGRVNVNTASVQVLMGLPNMTARMAQRIVAYRERQGGYASFPGRGVRTLTELMVPVEDAAEATPSTLAERDAAWASVENLCSVRSDVFAVYGYLEAVRANAAVTHNNGSDWYLTGGGEGGTSDDVHSATAKDIRVGRRRWVAIVDRSWSNYVRGEPGFVLPRVVAMKEE